MWDSIERLGSLISWANWGIAATLLIAFACTVVAIKASSRKDELTGAEDLRKAEHIAELDHANLTLRGQVATLETNAANANMDLAGLQKAAADAKAAQQNVEIDLERQKERTATAERSLLELRESIKDRRLSSGQYTQLLALLKPAKTNEPTFVSSILFDGEGREYAKDINKVLFDAEWTNDPEPTQSTPGNLARPVGLILLIRDPKAVPKQALVLFDAFTSVGLHPTWGQMDTIPPTRVSVLVGNKPLN
jgi:hypothetical protein